MATLDAGDRNYSTAVSNGHYDLYLGGLRGKHDNVRMYWEDQVRKVRLRQHLRSLVERKRRAGGKVRICDLGSGTGQGFQLLTSIMRRDQDLRLGQVRVLTPEMLDVYVGCDLCEAMVAAGRDNYRDHANVFFHQGDFSEGFPLKDEKAFDVYFCSYGSFSHIDDETMERLFLDVVEHVEARALFVGDWLGRWSIEWPCYWDAPPGAMQDYSMSWLGQPGESPGPVGRFPMRLWTGDEVRALAGRVAKRSGAKVRVLDLYDCSTFVGRHTDTAEYNDWVRPMRSAVNQLHQDNLRTDLEQLKTTVLPVPGHDELNGYFATLAMCWNRLVEYCQRRLEQHVNIVKMKNWRSFPAPLQTSIMTLDRVIDTVSWMQMGDPRANIIEPQLGYTLRSLEQELQEGKGCAHGLIGVFDIIKG